MWTVHSPEPGFSGDVAGVRFSNGSASAEELPAAALSYFRRRGYRVAETAPAAAPSGPDTDAAFDPADHTVAEVLAHLASADDDERARVLAAEAAGEARATILKKGTPSE